jgi:hypothetical protein
MEKISWLERQVERRLIGSTQRFADGVFRWLCPDALCSQCLGADSSSHRCTHLSQDITRYPASQAQWKPGQFRFDGPKIARGWLCDADVERANIAIGTAPHPHPEDDYGDIMQHARLDGRWPHLDEGVDTPRPRRGGANG